RDFHVTGVQTCALPISVRPLAQGPAVLEDLATLMGTFIQVIVSGLSIGSIYALVALGIVLLYRTTRILNFAHGDIGVLGTFIASSADRPVWRVGGCVES